MTNPQESYQAQRLIHMSNNGVKNELIPKYYCGFLADNGYHCVPDGLDHCAICKEVV